MYANVIQQYPSTHQSIPKLFLTKNNFFGKSYPTSTMAWPPINDSVSAVLVLHSNTASPIGLVYFRLFIYRNTQCIELLSNRQADLPNYKTIIICKKILIVLEGSMEEDVRFELTDPFVSSDFKSDAFGHSANLPLLT